MVVAAGMVVSFIEKDGLVNQIITLLGGDPVSFRTDPKWFPVVYTVTNIWKSFGWNSILYLSAMAPSTRRFTNRRGWTARTVGSRHCTSRCR